MSLMVVAILVLHFFNSKTRSMKFAFIIPTILILYDYDLRM